MFTNRQKQRIIDFGRRELRDYQDYFQYSVLQVLLHETFYELYKEGRVKNFMLISASQEVEKPKEGAQIPKDVWDKSVAGNSSYTILRDKHWEYVLLDDEEDLNLMRLLLGKGEHVVLDMRELQKKLGN